MTRQKEYNHNLICLYTQSNPTMNIIFLILKMGRERIIKQRTENREIREKREKNRQKYKTRLQELEKQVEAMKRELQKYGVFFTPAKI